MRGGMYVCVCVAAVACTTPTGHSTLPPVPACGWVHVERMLDRSAMRHSTIDAIAALRLGRSARVLRVDAVRAALPIATKVDLPPGSRRLWLIYTVEPKPADAGATSHLLRLVDDETLQPAGATACS